MRYWPSWRSLPGNPKCGLFIICTPHLSIYLSIYLSIDAVESKLGPKMAFFESTSFLFFSFSVFLQGEWYFQKNWRKLEDSNYHFLSQNLVQLCCAACLDQVLTQPWTKFWLNLFDMFGPFFLFQMCWNHSFYNAFSKNLHFLSPPQKIRNTICKHNCAKWSFIHFFLHFCFYVFLLCPVFWVDFLRGTNKKKTKPKTNNKKGKKTTRCKQQNHLLLFLRKKKPDNTDTKYYKSIV